MSQRYEDGACKNSTKTKRQKREGPKRYHNPLRKCCGLGGCGPHGCRCFCGVSCHGPLCCCPESYTYFLAHPEPQYPYTLPDYDGSEVGLTPCCGYLPPGPGKEKMKSCPCPVKKAAWDYDSDKCCPRRSKKYFEKGKTDIMRGVCRDCNCTVINPFWTEAEAICNNNNGERKPLLEC